MPCSIMWYWYVILNQRHWIYGGFPSVLLQNSLYFQFCTFSSTKKTNGVLSAIVTGTVLIQSPSLANAIPTVSDPRTLRTSRLFCISFQFHHRAWHSSSTADDCVSNTTNVVTGCKQGSIVLNKRIVRHNAFIPEPNTNVPKYFFARVE